MTGFYARLRDKRGDDQALQDCIEEVINRLDSGITSSDKPGMLLGKIQSGKTRGFLGIILKAFDREYDVALVFTKGTKTLARQTVRRISADFKEFIDDDEISVHDVMELPDKMTRSELKRKMVIVAKKEANNLTRVIQLFDSYPSLREKKILLVDDEADMASVRFVKKKGSTELAQGTIAQQMDQLRGIFNKIAFLQVTATPYALYLQPEEYDAAKNGFVFFPKRPAFTTLLPIHAAYVGGDDYFGDKGSADYRSQLFVEVPPEEQTALRTADGRAIREDRIWATKNIAILRSAIMRFFIATVIRRQQQHEQETRPTKYAMIIHNDTQRAAHKWQSQTVEWICKAFENASTTNQQIFKELFDACFADIASSVILNGGKTLDQQTCYESVKELILEGEVNVQTVNSDVQVASLLDPDTAELKLRTAANIFIGGSILDRGITIPALIAFYYGRNPQRMQADTVLQHSRMYGNRSKQDLAVTRFYTSKIVYQRLEQIHALETTLREAFESGANEQGVVFIENDKAKGVVPCAPNKIAASNVITVKPNSFYLPTGFDTLATTAALKKLTDADAKIEALAAEKRILIPSNLPEIIKILRIIQETLTKSSDVGFSWDAMEALLTYYCEANNSSETFLLFDDGRQIDRSKSGDKSGLSILGTSLRPKLQSGNRKAPALVLLRQAGTKDLHWSAGTAFWWPILATPTSGVPCVYSTANAAV